MKRRVILIAVALFVLAACGTPEPPAPAANTSRLTVNMIGVGQGHVASDIDGIACGNDCQEDYRKNTVVTLTASPNEDSSFIEWQGDCSGVGPCMITMTKDMAVTALFGGNKLDFDLPANLPDATVGVPYTHSFHGDNPRGGEPPYRFVQEAGTQFPPFGLGFGIKGDLSGTPTAPDTRTFGVCIVDAAGSQECKTTTVAVVGPEPSDEITGIWNGEYTINADVGDFCPNMNIFSYTGDLIVVIAHVGDHVEGPAKFKGVKSITIDTSTGFECQEDATTMEFTGDLDGTFNGTHLDAVVDFGDPDLFLNKMSIKGTLTDGTISGDVENLDDFAPASGPFSMSR